MIRSFEVSASDKGLDEIIKINRASWENRVDYDFKSSYYNVSEFKSGKNTLFDKELEELGLIEGKRILHLQSYFGLDSLSLCRLGAKEVIGLDFSQRAVDVANEMARDLNLNADFYQHDLVSKTNLDLGEFDIVFCSYGAFCWMPEIVSVAKKAFSHLKESGFFYVMDFHPIVYSTGLLRGRQIAFPTDNSVPLVTKWNGTYASPNAPLKSEEYNWNHSFEEIINSFSQNSFQIDFLNEHQSLPMDAFYNLERKNDGLFYSSFNNDYIEIPLSFSLKSTKIGESSRTGREPL